jgi:hypothetical protein
VTGTTILMGVAVALALEGLVYAVAPTAMQRALATLAQAPPERLRLGGLAAAAAGIALAWALKAA